MSEKLEFTSEDMERWAAEQTREVLKSLLRNLTSVRAQQSAGQGGRYRDGVVDGLNIAITAVRRRVR